MVKSSCHSQSTGSRKEGYSKILLMGLPNVGKSVVFSQLTGIDVMVSNYAGTTVDYSEGLVELNGSKFSLIDVPGLYNINGVDDEAGRVAVSIMKEGPSLLVCVLDAVNLESSLHLLMQLMNHRTPVVAVVNRVDLAKSKGVEIDFKLLAKGLGIPVVPTVAITGEGIQPLRHILSERLEADCDQGQSRMQKSYGWSEIERLLNLVAPPPVKESVKRKDDFLIKPFPGIPIALFVMVVMFSFVIGLGMSIRRFVLLPLFRDGLFPAIEMLVDLLVQSELLRNILVGEYGFLIKGIEWPFSLVLPYVISFYISLSILEDSGYLPRVGVLLDGIFKKIGLNGSCVIPLLLGYGCGIPAIMATRALPSRKLRIVTSTIVCFAVPCVSQTGAFISLLGERSLPALISVFLVSVMAMIAVGIIAQKIGDQSIPFTLLELPHLLPPNPRILSKKIFMRIKRYVVSGAVPMLIAVFFASILYELNILTALGGVLSPIVSGWLNLPREAAIPLVMGIVRRELTVLPLMDMELTTLQFFTGAIVALFYVPCIAMIATLAKEFGLKIAVAILLLTTLSALFIGGLIAQIGLVLSF